MNRLSIACFFDNRPVCLTRLSDTGYSENVRHKLLIFVGIIMIVNLLALNWYVLTEKNNQQPTMTEATIPTKPQTTPSETCNQTCIDRLYAAIATLSAETQTVITTTANGTEVTEYFVSFGSGTGNSTTIEDVTGMQTYVDPSQYNNVRQVVFEASVTIPTQNQSAMLQVFNETAQHPVWNSTVTFQSGAETQFLISQPVTLDPGNNLYQVQLQTQLGSPVIINQARFHITTY